MINFDDYVNENKTERSKNCPYIPDHPHGILITGGSESGKTNVLINLINEQTDIDKIYFYTRDLNEPNLIKKREDIGIKHVTNPNAFIECWNTVDEVYEKYSWLQSKQKKKSLNWFW